MEKINIELLVGHYSAGLVLSKGFDRLYETCAARKATVLRRALKHCNDEIELWQAAKTAVEEKQKEAGEEVNPPV